MYIVFTVYSVHISSKATLLQSLPWIFHTFASINFISIPELLATNWSLYPKTRNCFEIFVASYTKLSRDSKNMSCNLHCTFTFTLNDLFWQKARIWLCYKEKDCYFKATLRINKLFAEKKKECCCHWQLNAFYKDLIKVKVHTLLLLVALRGLPPPPRPGTEYREYSICL